MLPTLGHRAFGQASGAEAGARARGQAKHLAAQAEQPGVGIRVGKMVVSWDLTNKNGDF